MQIPDEVGIVIDGFPRDVAQALSFEDQVRMIPYIFHLPGLLCDSGATKPNTLDEYVGPCCSGHMSGICSTTKISTTRLSSALLFTV